MIYIVSEDDDIAIEIVDKLVTAQPNEVIKLSESQMKILVRGERIRQVESREVIH